MVKIGSIRRFNGKRYRKIAERKTKKDAMTAAKGARSAGRKVRIIKRKDNWDIYMLG